MIDYALSFPDQATWETLATEQGWVQTNEDGSIYFANPNMDFVVIGNVYPQNHCSSLAGSMGLLRKAASLLNGPIPQPQKGLR